MKLTVNISMDNAAFEDPQEIEMILSVVGAKAANGQRGGKIMDSNGNTVGRWDID